MFLKPILIATLVAASFLVMALPAAAHGAPHVREIDTRVMEDHDPQDYNALTEAGVPGTGGHDLLALDVRETFGPDGRPGLVLRLIVQGGDPSAGEIVDEVAFELGGTEYTLDWHTTDNEAFTSESLDWIGPKIPVGDGYPFAVDGFVAYDSIGGAPGLALENVHVHGHVGGSEADAMPGSFMIAGTVAIPETEEHAHVEPYTLKGPAPLFNVTVNATAFENGADSMGGAMAMDLPGIDIVEIAFKTNLNQTVQTLNLTLSAPDGVRASLNRTTVILAGGSEEQMAKLLVDRANSTAGGEVSVEAVSDLWDRQTVTIQVPKPMPVNGMGAMVMSGPMASGDTFQHSFMRSGTLTYHNHHEMEVGGQVHVVGETVATDGMSMTATDATTIGKTHTVRYVATDGGSFAFEPSALAVSVGDTVVWVNDADSMLAIMGELGPLDAEAAEAAAKPSDADGSVPAPGLAVVLLALVLVAVVAARRR